MVCGVPIKYEGPVVQLVRTSHLQCEGQRFESARVHQSLFTAEFASLGAEFIPYRACSGAGPLASAGISADLECVFCFAKCAAGKRSVALAPTHPCAGNDKELPNFV